MADTNDDSVVIPGGGGMADIFQQAATFSAQDVNTLTKGLSPEDYITDPEPVNPSSPPNDPSSPLSDGSSPLNDSEQTINLPPFLSDEFLPPEEFENSNLELEFYKQKYGQVLNGLASPDFQQKFIDSLQDRIASEVQDIEDFKTHYKAFKTNPEEYLKQQFPEYYESIGIPRLISEQEIESLVEQEITEKFGPDWRDAYNHNDLLKASSVSAKIYKLYNEKTESYLKQNEAAQMKLKERTEKLAAGKVESNPQPSVEELAEQSVRMYEEHFKPLGITEDEYIATLENGKNLQPIDLYRAVNFEKLMKAERDAAFEAGRKSLTQDLKSAGKKAAQDAPVKLPKVSETDVDSYLNKNAILRPY